MEVSAATVINKPIDDVWALVGDPAKWPSWLDGVTDVPVAEGAITVGTVLEFRWKGRAVRSEITQYEAGRVIAFAQSQASYDFREAFTVEAVDGGTRVSVTMGFEPTVLWMKIVAALATPLKGPLMSGPLKKALGALELAVSA